MSTITKFILAVCILFFYTVSINAQNADKDKKELEKYLVGAVPEEDGKVVFSETIHTKQNRNQITELVKQWSADRENEKDSRYHSKIVYNDTIKHEMAMMVDDRLVFSSNAFSLDFAIVYYYLIFQIEDEQCAVTIKNIKYKYADYKDLVTADEMISDKVALNKEKTKMYRTFDKFRIATVDMANNTFDELEEYLNKLEYESIKNAARSGLNTKETTAKLAVANDRVIIPMVVTMPAEAETISKAEVAPVESSPKSEPSIIKDLKIEQAENKITQLANNKSFAQSNFFLVGENVAYVRQLAAISFTMSDGKPSVVCYANNDGTALSQSQIMPSGKFKILYYSPNTNSYNKLVDLSKKYAKSEAYTDSDIALIEVFIENANDALRCNHLKIETTTTNNLKNTKTVEGLPTVDKLVKTNQSIVFTGELID